MGREGGSDSTAAVHSSIALLQERFRQLQRAKEMREERELLRACSQSERPSPVAPSSGQPPKWFLHPDLVHPSRTLHPPQISRLEPSGAAELPARGMSPLIGSWTSNSSSHSSYGSAETDVDTSLHL